MEQNKKILIVDDNEINRVILSDILSPDYEVAEACSGLEAVAYLKQHTAEVSLVLLDIVMPEMDGFEVLAVMNKNSWLQSIPVIMISAEVSSSYVDHAYDLGATDYITRPFDEKTVQRRVANTIMLYAKQQMLESMVAEQIMEKERSNSQMVEILSNIVEFRNGESGLHVLHVRVITDMLLQALRARAPQYQLTSTSIALITNASAMHDIGKISIDEKILNKPGRLTPEEFEIMKTHAEIGARMLEEAAPQTGDSDLIRVAHDICRWHHERYDGRGYPDGLKGDDIPISAQVVALADVYDALTSKRVYKPPFPHEQAVQMIIHGECGAFNPLLLDCLQECSEKLAREVDVKSPTNAKMLEARRMASELMTHAELKISGETLMLLEQEREKYRFLSASTGDIFFEYDIDSQQLEFSRAGAAKLELPSVVYKPQEVPELTRMVESIDALLADINEAAPEARGRCIVTAAGGERLFDVTVHVLWEGGEKERFSRMVGKLTPRE